jgi:hypothetical protein
MNLICKSKAFGNILETLVDVAGVEPAGGAASFPVSICDSAILSEALTEILTEILDKDRQILVTEVNRWKMLSEELKKVVLRITEK